MEELGLFGGESLRIAITGASGLIGRRLRQSLSAGGHRVVCLVRRPPQPDADEVYWDPEGGQVDAGGLEGADCVVHLAAASVAAGRWTVVRKEVIRSSRVEGTRLLSETLAELSRPPRVLVAASAIGCYGDRGDEELSEDSPLGEGFLPDVCREWESATGPARQAGIRVVNLRIGIVLSATGGALARMLTPFKLGLGGVIGGGRQYMSWIALDDLVAAIGHVMLTDTLSGAVNAVAPSPVSNREFTLTLAQTLRRPAFLPVPRLLVRLMFGEMGDALLLASARVLPAGLLASGFVFSHAQLGDALRHELATPRP